jgi:RimJ/RimL family protein N-acetyltransferase
MSAILIRKSEPADIAVIAEFQQQLALETENYHLDISIVKNGIKAMFDDRSLGMYFIAERNGEIVGCHSITYEWSDWRNGMVWWIQSVYVVKSQRKHGIFKAMFDNLKEFVQKDPGIVGLRLYVDKTNLRAQEVYQKMGMNGEHYSVFEMMKP